jgi:hypothetical protein
MDFLVRCKEYPGLTNDETIKFLRAAFSSSKIITIDTSILVPAMRGHLVDILVSLTLFPPTTVQNPSTINFGMAMETIKNVINKYGPRRPQYYEKRE